MRFMPLAVVAGLGVLGSMTWTAAAQDAPSIQQFLKIRTPNAPVLMPDGTLLVRDWPEGVWQLYRVTPAFGGSKSDKAPSYKPGEATFTKLTSFADGLSSFSVSPDGSRVVLLHAAGGNENTQLTFMDPATGATSPILSNPRVQASVNAWKADSSAFVYSANDESPNDFYIYRYDFGTNTSTKLFGQPGTWSAHDITADGARVLLEKYTSASDILAFELDVASGTTKDITIQPADGTTACSIIGYMPGETSVLLRSDYKDGISRLFVRQLDTGLVSDASSALADHEVDGAIIDPARRFVATTSNESGYGVARVFMLPAFEELPLGVTERGVVTPAGFRNNTVVWTLNNAHHPGAAFATTFPQPGGQLASPMQRQLTYTDLAGADLKSLPLPELVKCAASDGLEIPSFMYLPRGYTKGQRIPFVVAYHGGPEGQHRPTFSAVYSYLAAQGYGVLLPNVRGSVGFGRAYQMKDDYRNRWRSVEDGVDAAQWLVDRGYAATGQIATYGGSYGGYMSVACLVEDQNRIEAGRRNERLFGSCINVVGIVNLKTFLEKTSGYRRKYREAEYGPLTDPEFLLSVSPMTHIDKINVPVFIAHGFNDPRVPVEEAMQLAVALKDRGMSPRVFIAPDEGHGFQKLDNRVYFYERMVQFLRETIGEKE